MGAAFLDSVETRSAGTSLDDWLCVVSNILNAEDHRNMAMSAKTELRETGFDQLSGLNEYDDFSASPIFFHAPMGFDNLIE